MFIASPQFIGMAFALSMIERQFPISPISVQIACFRRPPATIAAKGL
jgi:hypothetical protein